MIENVTLETLPKAFMHLYHELTEMKKLIQDQAQVKQHEPDQLMTVEDAAKFLKLSPSTIYGLVSKGSVPYMKRGKRLYFTAEKLTTWLESGRVEGNQSKPPMQFPASKRKAA
jgi:excisionase family DNA binding protein